MKVQYSAHANSRLQPAVDESLIEKERSILIFLEERMKKVTLLSSLPSFTIYLRRYNDNIMAKSKFNISSSAFHQRRHLREGLNETSCELFPNVQPPPINFC